MNAFFEKDPLTTFHGGDLQIVLDLDLTLIYTTIQKPDPQDKDYIKLISKDYGGEMFVYKRPHLD